MDITDKIDIIVEGKASEVKKQVQIAIKALQELRKISGNDTKVENSINKVREDLIHISKLIGK